MKPDAVRVVLVGYGPVAARFVEEMLPVITDGRVTLTVIGAEREDAYNRVLVAEYAVGAASRDRLEVTDTSAARAAGVDVRLGEVVAGIDRRRQRLRLHGGEELAYDRLVLATGSRANIPTLDGLTRARRDRNAAPAPDLDTGAVTLPTGVVALRDVEDAAKVARVVAAHGTIIVLGAGVLGMEFALLAAEYRAQVVVVHHGPTPMARNLDEQGGRMLSRTATALGVGMAAHARAEGVLLRDTPSGGVFDGLVCADGTYLRGDMLVLSCGVSPRTELASAAGLACATGILVDEQLRSWSDPDIFAIGDCAQLASLDEADASGHVAGAPAGLIGPGWRQAVALARRLTAEARGAVAGEEAALFGDDRPAALMLKATGIDVVAGGDHDAGIWDDAAEVSVWADPGRGAYLKTVVRAGVLTGFVCVGLPRAGAELTLVFERGGMLPTEPSALLRLDAPDTAALATDAVDADATVCWCNGVSARRIGEAVKSGCASVDEVGRATRAGTGCGGCRSRIAAILAAAQPVPV